MRKILKKILIFLVILLLLIQLYPRPAKNQSVAASNEITRSFNVPADVMQVLKSSCYDCHSNNTVYPWYSRIQPVALWLDNHIKDGKKELNFSEFSSYAVRRQYRKFEEIIEQVKEGEMPLKSYTIIHTDSKISAEQKTLLTNWAQSQRTQLESRYPIDSLVRKK